MTFSYLYILPSIKSPCHAFSEHVLFSLQLYPTKMATREERKKMHDNSPIQLFVLTETTVQPHAPHQAEQSGCCLPAGATAVVRQSGQVGKREAVRQGGRVGGKDHPALLTAQGEGLVQLIYNLACWHTANLFCYVNYFIILHCINSWHMWRQVDL